MAKNILLFADGTGNEGGLLPDESRTNVDTDPRWMRCWSAGLNDENGSRMERMQILWRPKLSYALAILDEARQGRVRTLRSPRRCFPVSTLRRLTIFSDRIADCGCVA